jgi:hypothetical protein
VNAKKPPANNFARWLPVGGAGGLLAAVIVAGAISGAGGDEASAPPESGDPVATVAIGDEVGVVDPVAVPPESYEAVDQSGEAVVKVPLNGSLSKGSWGDDVRRVQERLAELAFDPGPIDGQFGTLTTQAVWAFEKLIMGVPRSEATGVVDAALWDRMQDPITVKPRRPTGGLADHTEVYLPQQVMVVFNADTPVLVAHISTGELAPGATAFTPWTNADLYCETITIDTDINGLPLDEAEQKQICGRSYTPPGVFEAYRKVEGVRNGPLGGMFDPIYINQGIAIHGAINVPLQPASHGCIRVSQYLGSSLQSMLELGDRVLIWDGVTEPEQQSAEAMKMRWDYPDPNATTTTSTTTTTTVAPTTVPETTVDSTNTTTSTIAPSATTTTSTTVPGTSTTVEPVDDL